jgi:hypothetical protein
MKVVALWQVSSFPTSPASPHGGAIMRIMTHTNPQHKDKFTGYVVKVALLSQNGAFENRPFQFYHQGFESSLLNKMILYFRDFLALQANLKYFVIVCHDSISPRS